MARPIATPTTGAILISSSAPMHSLLAQRARSGQKRAGAGKPSAPTRYSLVNSWTRGKSRPDMLLRAEDPADRRARVLRLSAEGNRFLARAGKDRVRTMIE